MDGRKTEFKKIKRISNQILLRTLLRLIQGLSSLVLALTFLVMTVLATLSLHDSFTTYRALSYAQQNLLKDVNPTGLIDSERKKISSYIARLKCENAPIEDRYQDLVEYETPYYSVSLHKDKNECHASFFLKNRWGGSGFEDIQSLKWSFIVLLFWLLFACLFGFLEYKLLSKKLNQLGNEQSDVANVSSGVQP